MIFISSTSDKEMYHQKSLNTKPPACRVLWATFANVPQKHWIERFEYPGGKDPRDLWMHGGCHTEPQGKLGSKHKDQKHWFSRKNILHMISSYLRFMVKLRLTFNRITKDWWLTSSSHHTQLHKVNSWTRGREGRTVLYTIDSQISIWYQAVAVSYLSKIGLPDVLRDVMPPVAPAAKKKNMPARSLGWRSFAAALAAPSGLRRICQPR